MRMETVFVVAASVASGFYWWVHFKRLSSDRRLSGPRATRATWIVAVIMGGLALVSLPRLVDLLAEIFK